MWRTVPASLAVLIAVPSTGTTAPSSTDSSLEIALLSFAGAVIGAVALVYVNRRKPPAPQPSPDPDDSPDPEPLPPVTVRAVGALQEEIDEIRDTAARRKATIDERLDDMDARASRFDGRLGAVEDWIGRSDRVARRVEAAGRYQEGDDDGPDTTDPDPPGRRRRGPRPSPPGH